VQHQAVAIGVEHDSKSADRRVLKTEPGVLIEENGHKEFLN
jgi:hypothetical protein